jgi:molecular chaperone GrpE
VTPQKTSWLNKLNALLSGGKNTPSAPDAAAKNGASRSQPASPAPPEPSPPPASASPAEETLADLGAQIKKLAKTQFKANTLQEKQLAQQQETLQTLQQTLQTQQQQAAQNAQTERLKALLPTLDGLDAAFENGKKQVLRLRLAPQSKKAFIAWLDGVRLARLRLLDTLAAHNVTPIPAIGQPFDPHRHVVVATKTHPSLPEGTIIAEDRRGYMLDDKVLRFAEVVVVKL